MAAALSLPLGLGLGHAVIGSPKRGAVWLVLLFGALAAMLKSIWFLPIAGVIFVAGVLDAFVLGFRKREQPPFRWVSPWVFVLPAISVASVLAIRNFVVESFRARSTSMAPTLQNGDMIFIDKVTAPARGDVIVFAYPCDPQRDYVFRMIADAGDSVEVRCGIVYVNGHGFEQKLVEKPETCTYEDYDDAERRPFKRPCARYREQTHEVFQDVGLSTGVAESIRDYPQRSGSQPMCFQNGSDQPRSVEHKLVETKPASEATPCEQQLHLVVPQDHVFVLGDNRNNANDSRVWGAVPKSAIKGHLIGIWGTERPGKAPRFNRFGAVQ